ncbi:hypothetical protein [Paraconexibacter algicola]|uniref:Uncharacterized protein n=1 Tax=Paraconexibacter algicola TaxID=2133960 RepID=A0A2T4UK22_9ACTN|nr:hypothetical protein [Paraconexibacter algicola]PTL59604.1 hypothetical protein C7Y72_08050 [Paraconexibacter algicola]
MRLRPLLPALALLALPSPALAADLAPAAAGAADALAAGGGGFAFTVRDLPSNRVRTRVGSPGGPTRTVSTSRPAGRREYGLAAGVARSSTRLAFGVTRLRTALDDEEPTALAGETFRGPLGGPFAVTAGGPGLARPFSTVVGYGGETLVTFEAEREFGAGRIVARDPAAGTAGRQIGPDAVIEARVAGTNVAIATETSPSAPATTITVYDLASGEQRYAVAVPRSVAPDGGGAATVPFDVDADGTIVAIGRSSSSTSATERLDLLVASPQATAPRVLRQDVTGAVVAISSGRVLHLARPSARVAAAGAVVLAVTGLAGSTSTVSFPLAPPVLADLDGDVLAVSTPTCVYAASFPWSTTATHAPKGTCPQTFVAVGSRPATRRGQVRVPLSCTMGTATGCRGTVDLVLPGSPKNTRRRLARQSFSLQRQQRTTRVFRLSATERRRLARLRGGDPVYLDVIARTTDDAGRVSTQTQVSLVSVR